MIQKPRFKRHFLVEIVEPDMVLLRSESNCIPLQGHLTTLLAPLMDGTHTIGDILEKLNHRATLMEVWCCLSSLEKA